MVEAMWTPQSLRDALGFNVTRLATLFRRHFVRAAARWDLTPEQWQILVTLVEADGKPLSQNDIAHVTLKDKHALSRTLDRMQRDGWITRRPDASDARAYRIEASARARRELPEIRRALDASFEPRFQQLPAADRRQLQKLVLQLIDVFEEQE